MGRVPFLHRRPRREALVFRDAFADIVSHELRTPIASITAASTLLRESDLTDAKRAELVEDIVHEADRLGRLTEDLVVLAQAERGNIRVHCEPVLLTHMLPRICDRERQRLPGSRLRLEIREPMPVASGDPQFVEQIVRNLIDNAAKYGPVEAEIEIVADAPGGRPRVRVLDRGPGVDPAEATRLFQVFYRSPKTAVVGGSGIGLFVVRCLADAIGGSVWARPRDDGPGAEFGFELQPLSGD